MRHILSVGADLALLHTRSLVLEQSPARVTGATPDQALRLLENRPFDLLVVCHTVQKYDAQQISGMARRTDRMLRMLLIETPAAFRPSGVESDYTFSLEEGPHRLIQLVRQLLTASELGPRLLVVTSLRADHNALSDPYSIAQKQP